jgi:hypothetical protein
MAERRLPGAVTFGVCSRLPEAGVGEEPVGQWWLRVGGEVGGKLVEVGAVDAAWVGERLVLGVDDQDRVPGRADEDVGVEPAETAFGRGDAAHQRAGAG